MPNNDLISRAAAINAICGCFYIMEAQGVGMTVARTIVKSVLDNAPAVDAVPVVHGRWIEYPECLAYDGAYSNTHIVCSKCHYVWDVLDNCTETFDYCPHCGAKMDGGENDD